VHRADLLDGDPRGREDAREVVERRALAREDDPVSRDCNAVTVVGGMGSEVKGDVPGTPR